MYQEETKSKTCCFFGHRKVQNAKEIENKVYNEVEKLITTKGVSIFLFGSKSEFDKLCINVVTALKEKYSYIMRIYVRAEYPYIDNVYKNYLCETYDDTYYPKHIEKAGKAVYVERNREMINKSTYCVVYYNEDYASPKNENDRDVMNSPHKSGTKLAYDFAEKNGNKIINVYSLPL